MLYSKVYIQQAHRKKRFSYEFNRFISSKNRSVIFLFTGAYHQVKQDTMAVHSGSGSSEKKSSNEVNELLTFNAENMQSNMKIIYYRFDLIAHF